MIDLDNNATTRPAPQVIDAMAACLRDTWHNPSSVHRAGQEARRLVELARASVAALVNTKPRQITFTSGGTEAIDAAIRGTLATQARPILVTSRVEHSAVRELAEELRRDGRAEVRWLPVDADGRIKLDAAPELIRDASLVSMQWANNETGVLQPIAELAHLCRAAGTLIHCDATQWVGKMPTDMGGGKPDVDLLTFAPHKFHGPKGVGVLWQKLGVRLKPTLIGTQEQNHRGGTENVPGIVGAGVAATLAGEFLADPTRRDALAAMRDRFEQHLLALTEPITPGVRVNSAGAPRLWNTSNIAFPRLEAEAILLALSERGVLASAGAACSSGSLEPSPVLLAMGIAPNLAHGSIRFSISRETSQAELDSAITTIADCIGRVAKSLA